MSQLGEHRDQVFQNAWSSVKIVKNQEVRPPRSKKPSFRQCYKYNRQGNESYPVFQPFSCGIKKEVLFLRAVVKASSTKVVQSEARGGEETPEQTERCPESYNFGTCLHGVWSHPRLVLYWVEQGNFVGALKNVMISAYFLLPMIALTLLPLKLESGKSMVSYNAQQILY